jgi:hypothetical protein
MHGAIQTASRTSDVYSICLASHLPVQWDARPGLLALTTSFSHAGLPITTLVLHAGTQSDLIELIIELHAANVAILRLDRM